MKKSIKIFIIVFIFYGQIWADAVSFDLIFSDFNFKGGVDCSAVETEESAGGYLEEPVIVYGSAALSSVLQESMKLAATCTQGGGDCVCYALYTDEVKLSDTESFYKVLAEDKKSFYWIKSQNSKAKKILELAQYKENLTELSLKNPTEKIYRHQSLSAFDDISQLKKIPQEKEAEIKKTIIDVKKVYEIEVSFKKSNQNKKVKFRKPGSLTFTELNPQQFYQLVSGEGPEASEVEEANENTFLWKVYVVKEENGETLIAARTAMADNRLFLSAGYTTGSEYYFTWIKTDTVEIKKTSDVKLNSALESPLYLLKNIKHIKDINLNGVLYSHFEEEIRFVDPSKVENENLGEHIIKVRDMWIRTYDQQGRINYWLSMMPGC